MHPILLVGFCGLVALLGGCARQISPNVYSESSIGETSQTFRGHIVSARDIQVEGKEKLEQNTVGLLGGGVGGAVIGNQFGGGRGNTAATVAGAAAGALAGAFIQKELEKQPAIEYTVQLSDGSLRTIVQGPEPRYSAGQKVLLMVYQKGRSRIVPDQSAF
jgi:outer membrane lipoprotein SlyB